MRANSGINRPSVWLRRRKEEDARSTIPRAAIVCPLALGARNSPTNSKSDSKSSTRRRLKRSRWIHQFSPNSLPRAATFCSHCWPSNECALIQFVCPFGRRSLLAAHCSMDGCQKEPPLHCCASSTRRADEEEGNQLKCRRAIDRLFCMANLAAKWSIDLRNKSLASIGHSGKRFERLAFERSVVACKSHLRPRRTRRRQQQHQHQQAAPSAAGELFFLVRPGSSLGPANLFVGQSRAAQRGKQNRAA